MAFISSDISEAAAVLLAGKPIALPTETVYGLAAIADDEAAVSAVFSMKNRPRNHPLIVHVADFEMIRDRLMEVPAYVERLREAFWPGPLSFVLKAKKNAFHPLVTGGQDSVAIRCPNHPLTLELLRLLAKPVVAPSANPFGRVSPTTAEHVRQSFSEEDLLILDGGRCQVGIESTIIDAREVAGYRILRPGMLGALQLDALATPLLTDSASALAVSGGLKTHYQPRKPLYYFSNEKSLADFCRQQENLFLIAAHKPDLPSIKYHEVFPKTAKAAAHALYYLLREADASTATAIVIELPPSHEDWLGVIERIQKAGQAI